MGLSSIASLSLGLSMSMSGTPAGSLMMRNLGVNTGPLQRLGGGLINRSNNSLQSQSPRPAQRSPTTNAKPAETTAESVKVGATPGGEQKIGRLTEDGEVLRSEGSPDSLTLADGVRQKVSVDVEPTPANVQLPPSTFGDSLILTVPELSSTTAAAGVSPAPPKRTSSLADASDRHPAARGTVNCMLLSTDDDIEPVDSISQPTISISLDSSDDDQDDDAPATSSSSAESISHILSSTQLSVDPRAYCIYNGPVNRGTPFVSTLLIPRQPNVHASIFYEMFRTNGIEIVRACQQNFGFAYEKNRKTIHMSNVCL